MVEILKFLKSRNKTTVYDICQHFSSISISISDILDCLCCMYVLDKIDYNKQNNIVSLC